jgi:hypothetical protein
MTDPRDDETRPLPPAAGESTAPMPPVEGERTAARTPPLPGATSRSRWSGRKTAVVVAAAVGLGTVGAVVATTAIAQSDPRVEETAFHPGQLPDGRQGQPPRGGPGRRGPGLPGGPAPGGLDRDGDGDHRHGPGDADGEHGVGGDGRPPGPGGSTDPNDANGETTVRDT